MLTLYGIPNCDTVKKARRFLEQHGVDYTFYDVKKQGLNLEQVRGWISELGWETVVNRKSATWRQLDDTVRNNLDAEGAAQLLIEKPTLMKRPLMNDGAVRSVGFSDDDFSQRFL